MWWAEGPLSPVAIGSATGGGEGRIAAWSSAGECGWDETENGLADGLIEIQVGPRAGEEHADAACGDDDRGGDLDEHGSPGASVAFAQRVGLTALVVTASLLMR